MNIHEKYIKRCIEISKNGSVHAAPNPSVGCVIVHDNRIIAEGYTSPYGGNHAEVNAIKAVKDTSLLLKATLYVSLEPCNHFGKTPPCSDLIIQHKIPTVVVGCVDASKKVDGTGIQKLRDNGCEVIVGVLEAACIQSNIRFFTYHEKKRPYIILKWAESKDGFIDKIRTKDDAIQPNWITTNYARQIVHKWRAEEAAILVGTNTVLQDNPRLDVRSWEGSNPTRIILDRSLRIPATYNIYDGTVKTIIITEKAESSTNTMLYEHINFSKNLAQQICEILVKHKLQSVFIEGGKQTLQTFIDANLWDEARIFIGEPSFKKGLTAPKISGKLTYSDVIKKDALRIIENQTSDS